jgi:3D (Asp-Asp-Asp) domain-containing protein
LGSLSPERSGTVAVSISSSPQRDGYWLATAPTPVDPPASQGTPLGVFTVTCYDLGGSTATGTAPDTSTVAVDPSVIPLGSTIYVDGAGTRVAQDTGGAIRGDRLDIWEPSYADCEAWGVQDRQVWLKG